ncbi:MAG: twitching motility protein PilU, partial [Reinekea sp.]
VHLLKDLMGKSKEQGMQTFDQALFLAYSKGEITYEDALSYADSANDLRLMIKLDQETDTSHLSGQASKLTIQESGDYDF